MSKIISANKLNRFWVNGVKPTVEKVKNTIKNRTDLMNNTQEGKLVDALTIKEIVNYLTSSSSNNLLDGIGELIPENADLNTYKTPGVYRSQNTDKTATLTNAPLSMGFKLIVMRSYESTIAIQIAVSQGNTEQSIKYRASKHNTDEWSQWQDLVYIHPTSSGNRHIPTGGKSGQFLKWGYDGGAVWVSDLDSAAAIKANTESGRGAGALGVKELYTELKTSFQDGCDTIVSGITAQGVTPTSNSPADIKTAVDKVATNKYNAGVAAAKVGTATPGRVLAGDTFTSSSGVGLEGTMPHKGNQTYDVTPTTDKDYVYMTIPESGYYNTSSKLKCNGILHMSFNNGLTAQTGNQTITHSREWTAEMTGRLVISMMYTSFAGIAISNGSCSCTVDGVAQTPTRDAGSGWDRVVVYSMYVKKGQKIICTGTLPETGNATHSVGQSWNICYVS